MRPDQRNYHLHILVLTRTFGRLGELEWEFAATKSRDIFAPAMLRVWRRLAVTIYNDELAAIGRKRRYTLDASPEPQPKRGRIATEIARRKAEEASSLDRAERIERVACRSRDLIRALAHIERKAVEIGRALFTKSVAEVRAQCIGAERRLAALSSREDALWQRAVGPVRVPVAKTELADVAASRTDAPTIATPTFDAVIERIRRDRLYVGWVRDDGGVPHIVVDGLLDVEQSVINDLRNRGRTEDLRDIAEGCENSMRPMLAAIRIHGRAVVMRQDHPPGDLRNASRILGSFSRYPRALARIEAAAMDYEQRELDVCSPVRTVPDAVPTLPQHVDPELLESAAEEIVFKSVTDTSLGETRIDTSRFVASQVSSPQNASSIDHQATSQPIVMPPIPVLSAQSASEPTETATPDCSDAVVTEAAPAPSAEIPPAAIDVPVPVSLEDNLDGAPPTPVPAATITVAAGQESVSAPPNETGTSMKPYTAAPVAGVVQPEDEPPAAARAAPSTPTPATLQTPTTGSNPLGLEAGADRQRSIANRHAEIHAAAGASEEASPRGLPKTSVKSTRSTALLKKLVAQRSPNRSFDAAGRRRAAVQAAVERICRTPTGSQSVSETDRTALRPLVRKIGEQVSGGQMILKLDGDGIFASSPMRETIFWIDEIAELTHGVKALRLLASCITDLNATATSSWHERHKLRDGSDKFDNPSPSQRQLGPRGR